MNELPAHELKRLRAVATDDAHLGRLVHRRLEGEPLQYLEGTAAFGPMDLLVDERVLIPRPETEQLWELSATLASHPQVVVDLCTGSGALALALADTFPKSKIHGSDLASDAIEVAVENGARTGRRVSWHHGDVFDALPIHLRGRIDLLVSNPPYISNDEFSDLPTDVLHEPMMALVSGPTGLEVIERMAINMADWLAPDGVFAIEIGETQGAAVRELFSRFSVEVRQDLNRRDRFVVGRRV